MLMSVRPSPVSPVSLSKSSWLCWTTLLLCLLGQVTVAFRPSQLASWRKETEDLFYHGYENYMKHAFPEDELRPITCKPLTRDRENPAHFEINDALGNYSLTLIDSLSTLAVLASSPSSTKRNKPLLLFQNGVKDLIEQYGDGTEGPSGQGLRARGFDLDSKVQVFETAIRGLGGLLSSHLFAVGDLPIRGYTPKQEDASTAKSWHISTHWERGGIKWKNGLMYNGQLLRLAYDLGSRLLPAFWTSTGIPYPRVNLRSGIPFYARSPLNFDPEEGQCDVQQQGTAEITETCSAGAGSLVIEFALLSRLTGDPRFEELAKKAFWSVWSRRSELGLIGGGVDAETGNWVHHWTGIGAGIDSFFEYAFKSYVLLSRDEHPSYQLPEHARDPRTLFDGISAGENSPSSFHAAWVEAHDAIKRHLYRGPNYQHPHYIQADLNSGAARGFWVDALSAYYPGLLAQAGYVEEAAETHLLQTALWTRFSGIPERWNLITGGIEGGLGWWVGRPEFIESTYHLYRATEDPWYFYVGEMVLRDIKRRCWTRCGWASIQNVLTGEKTDRMESFFLGETAKYLFLLFDPDHPLNHMDSPMVFSTEGHPLMIPAELADTSRKVTPFPVPMTESGSCPIKPSNIPFSISSTAARADLYHAAALARLHLMPTRDNVESVLGEYAADHPSITLADIASPSNYTYYPWTLPPAMVPYNATTAPMPLKPTFDISFPTLANQGQPAPPLQRVKEGILINFIGGLRLGMILDTPTIVENVETDGYRIQSINNLALGKDEKVFLSRETGEGVLVPADPNFTRVRDATMLDLVIDLESSSQAPKEINGTQEQALRIELPQLDQAADSTMKAAWNAIVSQISSMMRDKQPFPFSLSSPPNLEAALLTGSTRFVLPAITATGMGAAPIPAWPEAVPVLKPDAASNTLAWDKVYVADELCNHRLPASVPRNHQVLVLKRGGCPFSRKLANIPAYILFPTSLQLVVIVSDGNEENSGIPEDVLIRPLLDEQQMTSGGLARQNPIPLVMVAGGEKAYEALRNARGIGVKRRYEMRTQGIPITNLIIV